MSIGVPPPTDCGGYLLTLRNRATALSTPFMAFPLAAAIMNKLQYLGARHAPPPIITKRSKGANKIKS